MGERKGTNKYYPPDFDPAIHRSLDAYHGTHALRERAKKVKQGIIVIRFEMPYNIWCGGCGRHVAMGVRYNAEKRKVGMYYSTPVYEFNMKCHLCDQRYLIRTDPANYDYVIISGARRKEQRWDPSETRQIVPEDAETKRRLATDAMFRLEHGKADEARGAAETPRLAAVEADARERGAEDVRLNRLVRAGLRTERKLLAAARQADADLLARHSLAGGEVSLLPESTDDATGAKFLRLTSSVSIAATPAADAAAESPAAVAFETARPAEPTELRRRTGKTRQMLGVVVAAKSATSPTVAASATTSDSATSPTVAPRTTSDSATSPTVAPMTTSDSATSPTVTPLTISDSATSPTAASQTASESATISASSSATASAASSTVSATTSPTASATSSTATASSLDDDAPDRNDGEDSGDAGCLGGGLVQYSASPSPASSAGVDADDA